MKNNLKFYRQMRCFTQNDVAAFIGISRNAYGALERGDSLPSLRNAFLLARTLYVPITALFDFSDEFDIYNQIVYHDGLDNPVMAIMSHFEFDKCT